MKIYGTEYKDKSSFVLNNKINREKVSLFSKDMENSFLDKSKKDLKELLGSIKKKGDRIATSKDYRDVVEYKSLVKQYLKKVIDGMYELNKSSDTFNSRYYLTVQTVDKKLETLTQNVLNDEKDSMGILNSLDEIQGLLIDIYK